MVDVEPGNRVRGIVRRAFGMLAAAALICLLASYLILPLPFLKSCLAIVLSAQERAWLEYVSLISEVVLVVMFGEAIFSRQLAEFVHNSCVKLEAANAKALAGDPVLRQVVADFIAFSAKPQFSTKWADIRHVGSNFWTLYRYLQSYSFRNRMLLFCLSRAIPGGLYGALALWLALVHFGCDILLLQDLGHVG